ncbi:MAG: response regulator [Lachnospiraceae bacterium]|nr:response regulator [Lachnospiraceae bacterium]
MNLYSVLLVDDEEDVIQVMQKKIDWIGLGFRVMGYAHNGAEALEIVDEEQPDVVLTDIKMPYMDGLAMSRRLKERYPNIKILIFTGFDEFEYAKEAIEIEVEQYLLKPVNADELISAFSKIRQTLDREMDEKRNIDKLRNYYQESLPLLQENFFTLLIDGRIPEEKLSGYLTDYQIEFDGPYYIVTILHISTTGYEMEIDPTLMVLSVRRLAEEQLDARYRSRLSMYLGDIVVISQLASDDGAVTAYTDSMDAFCRQAKRVCGARVTAGVGFVCSRLQDLRQSYQGAREAVSYRAIYGTTRAINIAEIEPKEHVEERWEENAVSAILKNVRMGDRKALEEQISEYMRYFSRQGTSLLNYRVFILELVSEIIRFGNNNQIPTEQIFGEGADPTECAFGAESPEELWQWILEITEKVQDLVADEHRSATTSFVAKAREYVEQNYEDQSISIETICRQLGVSSAYFCTVFKKETGKTFIGYLTEFRMERAAEMLLTTDEKTYIIAEKTGYSDPNYFSYVFKKQYGVAPSRYRQRKIREREQDKKTDS